MRFRASVRGLYARPLGYPLCSWMEYLGYLYLWRHANDKIYHPGANPSAHQETAAVQKEPTSPPRWKGKEKKDIYLYINLCHFYCIL